MGRSRSSSILSSHKNISKIRQYLTDRKQELEEQLAQIHADQHPEPGGHDPGDQAMSSIMENLRNSLQNTELDEYKMIVKALDMIDEGTYGICIDCGRDISEKRLESYPNATRCVGCQEVFEER